MHQLASLLAIPILSRPISIPSFGPIPIPSPDPIPIPSHSLYLAIPYQPIPLIPTLPSLPPASLSSSSYSP